MKTNRKFFNKKDSFGISINAILGIIKMKFFKINFILDQRRIFYKCLDKF